MSPEPTSSGTVLVANRYELHEVLGRGSMGAVHGGRDVVLDRPVAVKLFPQDAGDPSHAVRYEQEAQLLARLNHPGLVTVYDAGIDASLAHDPKPYLVMEHVRGQTLAQRIRLGPLPPAEVASLASQLSSALAYIHRRGIVHRDIKPANILLAAPDEPAEVESAKLTDFGIARLIDGTRMTMTGFTLGTANYLSPEQISGEDVAAPSDIYSLGLVLLECLTGQLAYPGHGAEAAIARLHRPPAIPDSVPDGWARLLRAMTNRQPGMRPGAAEVGAQVTGLAGGAPPSRASDADAAATAVVGPVPATDAHAPGTPSTTRVLPSMPAPTRPARRRPWAFIAAGIAAVMVFAVVVVLATSGDGGQAPSVPTYPTVSGPLGSHLQQLQQDVARLGSDASSTVQPDVLALTTAASARDWPAARDALAQLRADVSSALAASELSAEQAGTIRTDIALIADDLAAKTVTSSSTSATHTTRPPAAPNPGKGSGHGKKGKGHG
jgi:hypothetical protein